MSTKTPKPEQSNKNTIQGFTNEEDMAIIKYITVNKRYLLSSGVQVWKVAEESNICPGRSYQSMKERFRKVLVKNLRKYNLEKELCAKILEFTRANKEGKRLIRLKES